MYIIYENLIIFNPFHIIPLHKKENDSLTYEQVLVGVSSTAGVAKWLSTRRKPPRVTANLTAVSLNPTSVAIFY